MPFSLRYNCSSQSLSGLLYFPTIFYMNEWFFRLRGTASGIVFAGTAAGGLILPLVFPPLITKYGAPKTLSIFSVAIACLLLPVIPYIKGRLPPRVYGPAPRASNRGWLTNPSFWLYTAVNLIQGFGYFMPVVWLPSMWRVSTSESSMLTKTTQPLRATCPWDPWSPQPR